MPGGCRSSGRGDARTSTLSERDLRRAGSLLRHQQPGDDVGDEQRAEAEDRAENDDQPHQVRVDAGVLRDATADAGQPAVVAAADQPSGGLLDGGLKGWLGVLLGHRSSPSVSWWVSFWVGSVS